MHTRKFGFFSAVLTSLVKDLNSPTKIALLLFCKGQDNTIIQQILYDAPTIKGSSSSPATWR